MFDTVLIANRGEIAVRIARTLRRCGIRSVGVFTEDDADSAHIAACDTAYRLFMPGRQGYLDGGRMIEIAEDSGAQAIHPGYGFLSEDFRMAEACAWRNKVFIGPPPSAMQAMANKDTAKQLMRKAGVPLLPGYDGKAQTPAALAKAAEKVGYPLLLKAVAGGGGKGMRVVHRPGELKAAIESARREAKASFGDGKLLMERYLPTARHIEVQIFADTHGNTVHLFERDCSLQRRYQKILEQAPAPGLDEAVRTALYEAAIKAARAIDYVGAGTVEFLLHENQSYFLEMNTRLQVEHPITEAITGQDLVEWQLRVAAGEPLPLLQDDITLHGHALEARLYAERPDAGFLPSTGRLERFRPPLTEGLRLDSGVREGQFIGLDYDPLLAKLIVHADTAAQAWNDLRTALGAFDIAGLSTNLAFLHDVCDVEALQTGAVHSSWLEAEQFGQQPERYGAPPVAALAAALFEPEAAAQAGPWTADGWRLNAPGERFIELAQGGQTWSFLLCWDGDELIWDGVDVSLIKLTGDTYQLHFGESVHVLRLHQLEGGRISVHQNGRGWIFAPPEHTGTAAQAPAGHADLSAPMPGRVLEVAVAVGDKVAAGARLVVLEAMKMEYPIEAPTAGVVRELYCAPGSQVERGATLLLLESEDD